MNELFRYRIHEAREMVLCDDGRWYCHDRGLPPRLWGVATAGENAMGAEIERLRNRNAFLTQQVIESADAG